MVDVSGVVRVAAPRDQVWAGLNDTDVLRRAIPGCEHIEKLAPERVALGLKVKVGPVRARFGGRLTIQDADPPNGYTLLGEGEGVMGFARGGARIRLEADGDATLLHYAVLADAGGRLAGLGARLLSGTARRLADDFFQRLSDIAAGRA